MASLIEDILTRAGGLAEGIPVSSRTFLDLRTKAAIRNALLRLLQSQKRNSPTSEPFIIEGLSC